MANIRGRSTRGTYSLAVDLFARDAADKVAALTAPDRLGFTPPPKDLELLGRIGEKADHLSSCSEEKLIPL